MNSTCDEESKLIKNPFYINIMIFCALSQLFSFCFNTVCMLKFMKEIVWHKNIKKTIENFFQLLLIVNLVNYFFLASVSTVNFTTFLFKVLSYKNPCDVLLKVKSCSIIRWCFLLSFCMISLNHASIVFERFCATCRLSSYQNKLRNRPALAVILFFLTVAISFGIVFYVTYEDDLNETVPHCLSLSATKMGPHFYTFFVFQMLFEWGVFITLKRLINHNILKKKELLKNLRSKYQILENIQVLEQLTPLIRTCSIIISSYDLVALSLRFFKPYMTKNLYIILTFHIFVIPHLPFILSHLTCNILFDVIQKDEVKSRQEMVKHLDERPTPEVFTVLPDWNQAYDRRFNVTVGRKRWFRFHRSREFTTV